LSLDLAFDDGQQAIHDALARFCSERDGDADASFDPARWRELAQLGVLALTTPEGDGGATELTAALEALGAAAFPGPLAATFLAVALLPDSERARVADGEALVSLGTPPLLPWAPLAEIFLVTEGGRLWRATPTAEVAPVATLGGEQWGRLDLERGDELDASGGAFALFDLAQAVLLAAHGEALLAAATEHARTRRQFGQPIGAFQAVAHPLADASIRLASARTLARSAACAFDAGRESVRTATACAAARLSARGGALEAAHTAHQVFGALGITLEGPAFGRSRRIRQLASLAPSAGGGRSEDLLLALAHGAREDRP
jgi:alkylation response protein AidB-like acyl-CoA dehydrogenase